MKGNRKPRTHLVKEGSRAFRRDVANPHFKKKYMKALQHQSCILDQ